MNSKAVLDIFKTIATIPRESGHEEKITRWLVDWAEMHNLEHRKDKTGNVLIVRPAAEGKENVPTIVLQAHQDMVCEKAKHSAHNFETDPLKYVIKDGWMIAEETTLGADDGIGIAACLALLEDKTPTGKIECLFTISEETGMDGAFALKPGFFEGRTLINLDSEDEGQLFIGCAGGIHTDASFRIKTRENIPLSYSCVRLDIGGGIGGHSGDDINKNRMNAVQELARFLYYELKYGFLLISIDGGGKSNAIAREAEAVIAVENAEDTVERFKSFSKDILNEFHTTEPDLTFSSTVVESNRKAVDKRTCRKIITSLFICPHGVYSMNQDIDGLVETSTNLASVHTLEDSVKIQTSQRSSQKSQCDLIAAKVEANFKTFGAVTIHNNGYPGWAPNMNSNILNICVESYRELFNQEPEVKAIHAGLECGLFLEKFPGLDMISFGPTLRGVHAPGEKLDLASLDKFVMLLEDVVCRFR